MLLMSGQNQDQLHATKAHNQLSSSDSSEIIWFNAFLFQRGDGNTKAWGYFDKTVVDLPLLPA